MTVRVPHPIPYQGSKRRMAGVILSYFPPRVKRLVEPFAGSGAVSLAAALWDRADSFWLNDLDPGLMALWDAILNRPHGTAEQYRTLWEVQRGHEREFYDQVRDRYNQSRGPALLLYLLHRCVKASPRYSSVGHFNQGPDNRRRGAKPENVAQEISAASALLSGRTKLICSDYRDVLFKVTTEDLVYMDPPYQGVSGRKDPRYLRGIEPGAFFAELDTLNRRGIPFILSYDGLTGRKTYGAPLPGNLGLTRVEVDTGRSSQATLLGRVERTVESLYLSPALIEITGPANERSAASCSP